MTQKEIRPLKKVVYKGSNYIFIGMGISLVISSLLIMSFAFWNLLYCIFHECDLLNNLLDFVGYQIITVAIFDVGRYLLEEEVFRDRELRSPREARQSLTKFMVIMVIAVTLEALLNVIRAGARDFTYLLYPAGLFIVATSLLVGLGLYQRLSSLAESEVHKLRNN